MKLTPEKSNGTELPSIAAHISQTIYPYLFTNEQNKKTFLHQQSREVHQETLSHKSFNMETSHRLIQGRALQCADIGSKPCISQNHHLFASNPFQEKHPQPITHSAHCCLQIAAHYGAYLQAEHTVQSLGAHSAHSTH